MLRSNLCYTHWLKCYSWPISHKITEYYKSQPTKSTFPIDPCTARTKLVTSKSAKATGIPPLERILTILNPAYLERCMKGIITLSILINNQVVTKAGQGFIRIKYDKGISPN